MIDSHTNFPGLAEVAATEHLAVVSDFDGTLAASPRRFMRSSQNRARWQL